MGSQKLPEESIISDQVLKRSKRGEKGKGRRK